MLTGLLVGCLVFATSLPARAALGADAGSIESDVAAMQGTMAPAATQAAETSTAGSENSAPYEVKSFVTPTGTTVREYVAASGKVFGVGWQGHRPPDLSILLGSHYSEYTSAAARRIHHDMHRSMTTLPDTVVVMAGHMGHVAGHAYVPSLVPAGLDPKAVVK